MKRIVKKGYSKKSKFLRLFKKHTFHKQMFEVYGMKFQVSFALAGENVVTLYDCKRLEKLSEKNPLRAARAEVALDRAIVRRICGRVQRRYNRAPMITLASVA